MNVATTAPASGGRLRALLPMLLDIVVPIVLYFVLKKAGLSALILLWPTWIFGMVVGAALAYLSTGAIPRCNRAVTEIIFHNFEDLFYKLLKKDREVNNPKWPFFVRVNDEETDRFRTNDMLYGVAAFISRMSQYLTLYPGDVVWMGTDGWPRNLKHGDVCEIEITGIGIMRKPIVLAGV